VRYLVRHADAGDKHRWIGPDDQRPLSDIGRNEADGLVVLLANRAIAEILSSPATRCRQTVQPLADQRRLTVRAVADLAVDADVDNAVELLLGADSDDVVWCTHGELIDSMLAKLQERGAPISNSATWPKGSVWLFQVIDRTVTRAIFLPPMR
jgi:phosphohistidine phosphatase SixA